MIWAKVKYSRENILKGFQGQACSLLSLIFALSKKRCQMIQGSTIAVFWISHMSIKCDVYCGNPRDGCYFHQKDADKKMKPKDD